MLAQMKESSVRAKDNEIIAYRRSKVLDYLAKGFIQSEIARELRTSEPTVSRDVEFLRTEAISGIDHYIENLPLEHKKALAVVDSILKDAFELAQSDDLESNDRIAAMKLVISTVQARTMLVTDAGILDKAVKHQGRLKEKIEVLQRSAPKYEILTEIQNEAGKAPTVRRILKRISAKKKEESAPVV